MPNPSPDSVSSAFSNFRSAVHRGTDAALDGYNELDTDVDGKSIDGNKDVRVTWEFIRDMRDAVTELKIAVKQEAKVIMNWLYISGPKTEVFI